MATDKPNILIILADDLGVDTLRIDPVTRTVTVQVTAPGGVKVGPRSLPNITRLLKSGINFTRAWAQPVCSPTRASLFTGLHPWQTRVGFPEPDGNSALPQKAGPDGVAISSLAEELKKAGYSSGLFGKWHLGQPETNLSLKRTPTEWGWDRFEGVYEGGVGPAIVHYGYDRTLAPLTLATMASNPPKPPAMTQAKYDELVSKVAAARQACKNYLTQVCPDFIGTQPDISHFIWEKTIEDKAAGTRHTSLAPSQRSHMYSTKDQISSAHEWIKTRGSVPWCVALTLTTPHDPFHVPPKESYTLPFVNPAAPTRTEMYVAMVEAMDYYIGKLMLDTTSAAVLAQLKSTVILFAGDNGTPDHDVGSEAEQIDNDRKDKGTHYIGGVHVPMIVADGAALYGGTPFHLKSGAGVNQVNTDNANIVHLADVFKTALAIAGAAVAVPAENAETPTFNLNPYLKGNTPAAKRAFNFSQQFPLPTVKDTEKFATIVDDDFRYKLACRRVTYVDGGTGDVYEYKFSMLKPHATIPGNMQETEVADILDLRYVSRVLALYAEMKKYRLDGGNPSTERAPLPFPPLPDGIRTIKKVRLKSSKDDYLHRADGAPNVTTYGLGVGSEWTFEAFASGNVTLKSWKDDFLLRPDQPTGVTTGASGAGTAGWIVEPFEHGTVRLKSANKGDYLLRTDQPQGVTTGGLGSSAQWTIELV